MSNPQCDPLLQLETTCGSLLHELQVIWDEVGESDTERDKMLLELEQECLDVYRKKVDNANKCRAKLRQAIADSEAELAVICAALGERPVHIRQVNQSTRSLKDELQAILPELEEMRKRKCERKKQFLEVVGEIQKFSNVLYQSTKHISSNTALDETDLSLRRLEDFHKILQDLQNEKSKRLNQVLEHLRTLNSLCSVLGMNYKQTVGVIHPSLGDCEGAKSISNDTIQKLTVLIKQLREVKIQRMQKLQDLATTMLELWNLMDTPIEEQQMFQNVTCNVAALEDEITDPDVLSIDFINNVKAEVCRLEELKSSKMKELVLKKKTELEEICRKTHMVLSKDMSMEHAIESIESGTIDPSDILEQFELQTSKLKEVAFARKEILEKVDKWMAACEEESWLDEYNRDDTRYNAGRGAHLTLKRAEKARSLVTKIPAMVETLVSKVILWEKERGIEFTYDGIRLLSMLEDYTILQQEKEHERRRQREQKKLEGQFIAEQEALFGSKPSPVKTQISKKAPRVSSMGGAATNRRLSLGPKLIDPSPNSIKAPHHLRSAKTPKSHHANSFTPSSSRRGVELSSRIPFSPSGSSRSNVMMPNPLEVGAARQGNGNYSSNLTPKGMNPSKEVVMMVDVENRTPNNGMSMPPATPASATIPMQTYMTPCTLPTLDEEIEYSFEERRAGFVLPGTMLQV